MRLLQTCFIQEMRKVRDSTGHFASVIVSVVLRLCMWIRSATRGSGNDISRVLSSDLEPMQGFFLCV